MARPLLIRKLRAAELRRLHRFLEGPLPTWQRRRAEALLLYHAGLDGQAIAHLLGVHPNTIYTDLHAFGRLGLASLQQQRHRGPTSRLSPAQIETICQLADQPPTAVGLPYGRWSLDKLRAYLLRHRLVKAISREYLRRLLEKRGFVSAASAAS